MSRFPLRAAAALFAASFCAGALTLLPAPVRGQVAPASPAPAITDDSGPSDAELGEAAQAVRDLRAIHPKLLAIVFDVSGSMKGENLRRARTATITLLRQAVGPGDRVVLYTFGAGYQKVFDQTVNSPADARKLIDSVPSRPGDGAGTNIRRPHHEALKLAESLLPTQSAIVLMTDSFNDTPKTDDPAYVDYTRYYIPGARLDRYPDTPENRDYERLLARMSRENLKVYGIGVQIDRSGRPVERLPQTAPSPAPERPREDTGDRFAEEKKAPKDEFPWLLLGLIGALAVGVGGFLAFTAANKPTLLRIGGPGGKRDYGIKRGQPIRLGGDGASVGADGYPLPGVKSPAAMISGGAGRFEIAPGPQPDPSVRVFHNGVALEARTPLRFGDEIRISVGGGAASGGRDFRLSVSDPKADLL